MVAGEEKQAAETSMENLKFEMETEIATLSELARSMESKLATQVEENARLHNELKTLGKDKFSSQM